MLGSILLSRSHVATTSFGSRLPLRGPSFPPLSILRHSARGISRTPIPCDRGRKLIRGDTAGARAVWKILAPRWTALKGIFGRHKKSFTYITRTLRLVRIPFVMYGVYNIGKQQGVIEYVTDPQGYTENIYKAMFLEYDIEGVVEGAVHDKVERIGTRIVRAAQKLTGKELEEAHKSEEEDEEELERLTEAYKRIRGRWSYVVLDTDVANAFVTEMLPRTIFVTTGLLNDLVENDDELALILGHEISHMIHGHNTESNAVELMLKTVEVLILSLDPSEGFLSLLVTEASRMLPNVLTLSHSRHCEHEADETGIKVAAMACFDTNRGVNVFRKMDEGTQQSTFGRFLSTHPPTKERYEFLEKESKNENSTKYANCFRFEKNLEKSMRSHYFNFF